MCDSKGPSQVSEEVDKDWIEQHQDGKCSDCGTAFGDPNTALSDQSQKMPFLCTNCANKNKGGY